MVGDGMNEYTIPSSKHANKKRKLESGAADADDGGTIVDSNMLEPIPPSTQIGRGKVPFMFSPPDGGLETVIKPVRKKPGPKKKVPVPLAPDLAQEIPSVPPSMAGDITPSISRASSPAPVNTGVIFELDEVIPPLKKAKKMDDATMLKRVKALEDAQRKVWTNIARRDVVKVYKYHTLGFQARLAQSERIAKLASLQARRPYTRTAKTAKEVQAKAKRLMREMQVFWKKNEREERDVRKREQKEAMDRLKIEEERREAARQARKLEFLISQTELYSHFVGSKLKTAEVQGDEESVTQAPAGSEVTDVTLVDSKKSILTMRTRLTYIDMLATMLKKPLQWLVIVQSSLMLKLRWKGRRMKPANWQKSELVGESSWIMLVHLGWLHLLKNRD
eukprot:GHVO01051838.1.p1 GENE.GHVO01051838.1~~GHVO01051838.1.p1  ORF type:complete len:391 (-),score=51.81 GHVO01051838.1:1044-2216(-)